MGIMRLGPVRLGVLMAGLSACASATVGPSVDGEGRATTTSRAPTTTTAATIPATTTTTASAPENRWLDHDDCRVRDATPSLGGVTSGFPRSPAAQDPFRDLSVSVVLVELADAVFTPEAHDAVRQQLETATAFFSRQTQGRFTLRATVEPDVIRLPGTVGSYGLAFDRPQHDHSSFMRNVVRTLVIPPSDAVAVFLPFHPEVLIAQASGTTTLVAGHFLGTASVLTHELVHLWLGVEDLYDFDTFESYLGSWDVMANSGDAGPRGDLISWTRWQAGWLADEGVACVTEPGTTQIELTPLHHDRPGLKSAIIPLTDSSAMVIEARDSGDDTESLPVTLAYVVDTTREHGRGPIRLIGELHRPADTATRDGVTVTLSDVAHGRVRVIITQG